MIFILTDKTRIIFRRSTPESDLFFPTRFGDENDASSYVPNVGPRRRGEILIYIFVTNNWKGVSAKFRLMFKPRPMSCLLCGRTLTQDFYDGVEQSNIIFDLHPQVTELLV